MELIKRKILLENSIDREYNSPTYGLLTATSFYINVILTQNIDDMGMFTDITYLPDFAGQNTPVNYTPLIAKLQSNNISFPFMDGIKPSNITSITPDTRYVGASKSDYYKVGDRITGNTESRIEDVKAYSNDDQYKINFYVENEQYINFSGDSVDGVSNITNLGDPITYVFMADKNDPNIGQIKQKNGLLFNDFLSNGTTTFSFNSQGWNQTNISLSGITKEEYLFGIVSKPEVKSDIFIDRGITTIFEKHLKISEIRTLDELQRYGRGYFNVTKYQ